MYLDDMVEHITSVNTTTVRKPGTQKSTQMYTTATMLAEGPEKYTTIYGESPHLPLSPRRKISTRRGIKLLFLEAYFLYCCCFLTFWCSYGISYRHQMDNWQILLSQLFLRQVLSDTRRKAIQPRGKSRSKANALLYADDLALLATTKGNIQRQLERCARNYRLELRKRNTPTRRHAGPTRSSSCRSIQQANLAPSSRRSNSLPRARNAYQLRQAENDNDGRHRRVSNATHYGKGPHAGGQANETILEGQDALNEREGVLPFWCGSTMAHEIATTVATETSWNTITRAMIFRVNTTASMTPRRKRRSAAA